MLTGNLKANYSVVNFFGYGNQIKSTKLILGCIPLGLSGSTIQDRSDHGASKKTDKSFPRFDLLIHLMHHGPG